MQWLLLCAYSGFVKYKRATYQYRPAKDRVEDWEEIYNHQAVVEGLRIQAARYR
jgi:glutamate synthase (NADPH/NADH)